MAFKTPIVRSLIILAAAGVLATVAATIYAPDKVTRAADKVENYLRDKLAQTGIIASAEAAASDDWIIGRASLKRWRANIDVVLGPGQIRLDGRDMKNLTQASRKMRDGSILEIGSGTYDTGIATKANNILIIGRGHVTFRGAAAKGKGTFIVNGNNTTIENIECRDVKVKDGNGACVRLQGKNLTLKHVFFHSSQQGLLTGNKPGKVVIVDSFFERLGHGGRAHGIYQGGGVLEIDRSYFLGAKSQGHEVKSRAKRTTITNSVIASMTNQDSRLIDISNGGIASITDCTLQQGPKSSNLDAIGFAVEKKRHKENAFTLKRNVIILERKGNNRLFHTKIKGLQADITDNIIVSEKKTPFAATNLEFEDRQEAGLPAYPEIPDRPTI
ncbi:hypothetical protein [Thiosocius teredinicola]|uniref:hypothetical protein n=1 Tax=Thiosocius teredinicola TaxID=1973002 RepID=UPI000991234D